MKTSRIVFGLLALIAYFVLLAAGLTRDSKPYRDRLEGISPAPAEWHTIPPEVSAPPTPIASEMITQPTTPTTLPPFDLRAFLAVMILYTPLNVALLTLLAGFVGGCASNLTFERDFSPLTAASSEASVHSIAFRTENPFASMFRSLVVYLGFMAGIYITTDAPFDKPTAEQYVRLAASMSFFAFIIGYDPTRLRNLIDLFPRVRPKE
jgi:hypothetical protein